MGNLRAATLARVGHQAAQGGMDFKNDLRQAFRLDVRPFSRAREDGGGDLAAQFVGDRHELSSKKGRLTLEKPETPLEKETAS
jgi:hypothetical protein